MVGRASQGRHVWSYSRLYNSLPEGDGVRAFRTHVPPCVLIWSAYTQPHAHPKKKRERKNKRAEPSWVVCAMTRRVTMSSSSGDGGAA